jgi:hypothetical protein
MDVKDMKSKAYDLGKKLNELQAAGNKIVQELNKLNEQINAGEAKQEAKQETKQ